MNRVRCLVNAELDSLLPNGDTKLVQIGAGCFLDTVKVETFKDGDDTFADITLANGAVLYGVLWSDDYWENHGAPQTEKVIEETVHDSIEILEPASDEEVEEDE
jgi:hypothetical protein